MFDRDTADASRENPSVLCRQVLDCLSLTKEVSWLPAGLQIRLLPARLCGARRTRMPRRHRQGIGGVVERFSLGGGGGKVGGGIEGSGFGLRLWSDLVLSLQRPKFMNF